MRQRRCIRLRDKGVHWCFGTVGAFFFRSGHGGFVETAFLQASMLASGAMLLPGVMQAAWAAGSDKPEQETVRIGFIPLTDCAPVVIAALKGFDKNTVLPSCPPKRRAGRRCATSWWRANSMPRTFFTACCTDWSWASPASHSRWLT